MNDSSQLKAYRDKLKELLDRSNQKALEERIVPAANKLLATVKNRIQRDGERSDGSKIGQYSTKPIYVSADQFDKKSSFKPIGKNETKRKTTQVFAIGSQKKKSVAITNQFRERKSMFLLEGYKQLRDIQGKPTQFINLTYRGDLMASYQQQVTNNAILQGLISQVEALKRSGLEARLGQILKPQKSEIDQYREDVTKMEKEQIINAFRNA